MGYRWEAPGNNFKKFLAELNIYYLMNKLGKKAFNLDGTIKNVKNWIISCRREGNCTKKEARYVWDYVIDEIQQYNIKDEGFFWGIINSNLEHIVKVDENYFEGIEVDCEWSDYVYKIIDIFSKYYGFSFNQMFYKWLDKNNIRKYYEQNISADEILRNRKKDRHIKLPFCIKARGTDLGKQFKKIAEEFAELGAENAIILNKIQAKQDISINNIKNTFFEAF